MRALLIPIAILLLTECSRVEEEPLGRLQKIEVFFRSASPGETEAELLLYRLTCDKRVIVCHHGSGVETPEQEVQSLKESIKKWRQLSDARRTSPLALLNAIDFADKDGKVYGGEVHLVFYPDARNILSMNSVDFSGGLFQKIEPDMEVRSTDKRVVSLEIGSESRWRKTVDVGTKDAATGP